MTHASFWTSIVVSLLLQDASDRQTPPSAAEYVARGMNHFRANRIADSIRSFETAAKSAPNLAPQLWQLGISDYYAGRFEHGRGVFEMHRTVNPHDVENAVWHFLCVARLKGLKAARKSLIEIDTAYDRRVPMKQIYGLYAGRQTEEDVLNAASSAGTESAKMYANLYLGLFYEVSGQARSARKFMQRAASAKLKDHYMHDVAKVHLAQRKWD